MYRFQEEVRTHLDWALFKLQATEMSLLAREDVSEDQVEMAGRVGRLARKLGRIIEEHEYFFPGPPQTQEKLPF